MFNTGKVSTHFMNSSNATGIEENTFRERGLPGVDMGRYTDITLEPET